MLTDCPIVGFVPTRSISQARSFYEGLLNLKVTGQDAFALIIEAGGSSIRVVNTPEFTPAKYTILGWKVGDIAAEARDLANKGVQFQLYSWIKQDELGIWVTPDGSRVAWFTDPDGNVLSISQSAA